MLNVCNKMMQFDQKKNVKIPTIRKDMEKQAISHIAGRNIKYIKFPWEKCSIIN